MKDLKDHEIAALVNELRDTAIQFRDTQQLRERIARVVHGALGTKQTPDASFVDYMTAEYGKHYARGAYPEAAMRKCWTAGQAAPLQLPAPGTTEYGSWINRAQDETNQRFSRVTEKFKWLCGFEQALRRRAGDAARTAGAEANNTATQ